MQKKDAEQVADILESRMETKKKEFWVPRDQHWMEHMQHREMVKWHEDNKDIVHQHEKMYTLYDKISGKIMYIGIIAFILGVALAFIGVQLISTHNQVTKEVTKLVE